MSELSTRIWLDERLWEALLERAAREQTTTRELIPHLVGQAIAGRAATVPPPAPTLPLPIAGDADGADGPPLMPLSEVYRCSVCGIQVRLGGVSQHMGKHLKERQAAEGS